MSDDSDDSSPKRSPRHYKPAQDNISPRHYSNKQDNSPDRQIELLEENNNLRRKLKQLSARLDEELEKAAKLKLKNGNSYGPSTSTESQSLELKNAYKMIERLQKTVRDYEAN